RRQDRHRVRARRVALEELLHVLVDQAVLGQSLAELLDLGPVRQVAVDQQVAGLGELRVAGDLLDRVAAIAEDALLAVDEGDLALARPRVAVARIERDVPRALAKLGHVDRLLAFRADDDGEFVLGAVEDQPRFVGRRGSLRLLDHQTLHFMRHGTLPLGARIAAWAYATPP